jgi:hypothetical protein
MVLQDFLSEYLGRLDEAKRAHICALASFAAYEEPWVVRDIVMRWNVSFGDDQLVGTSRYNHLPSRSCASPSPICITSRSPLPAPGAVTRHMLHEILWWLLAGQPRLGHRAAYLLVHFQE